MSIPQHSTSSQPVFADITVSIPACSDLQDLARYGLIYLASPYTKYQFGIEVAFRHASAIAAELIRRGINAFSPIAHSHPIAVHGGLNPLNHHFWLKAQHPYMDRSDALLVACLDGWDVSYGVGYEIDRFTVAEKPIYHLDPWNLVLIDGAQSRSR